MNRELASSEQPAVQIRLLMKKSTTNLNAVLKSKQYIVRRFLNNGWMDYSQQRISKNKTSSFPVVMFLRHLITFLGPRTR
jgi:hypothetical protein